MTITMNGEQMRRNAKVMYGQAHTESGAVITGLVHGRYSWIYWNATGEFMACERCGTREAASVGQGLVTAQDMVEWSKRLVPFSDKHSTCLRGPAPATF